MSFIIFSSAVRLGSQNIKFGSYIHWDIEYQDADLADLRYLSDLKFQDVP